MSEDTKKEKGALAKVVNFLKSLKEILVNLSLILLFLIFLYFIFKDRGKEIIVVQPFNIEGNGFNNVTGDVAASILRNKLREIRDYDPSYISSYLAPNSKTTPDNFNSNTSISSPEKDYQIKDPLTGIGLKNLKDYIQDLFLKNKVTYQTYLSSSDYNKYLSVEDTKGNFYSRIFSKETPLDSIIDFAAEFIIEKKDPFALGNYYLKSKYKQERCLEFAQFLLNDDDATNDYKGLYLRGHYYIRNSNKKLYFGDFNAVDLALADFRSILKKNPEIASVWNIVGWIHEQNSKKDSALYYYRKAIEKDKNFVGTYLNMGNVFLLNSFSEKNKKRSLDSAQFYFEKAISINKNEPIYYMALGNTFWEMGDKEKAKLMFIKAIQIDLNNPRAYHQLGLRYMYERDTINALIYLKNAQDLYKKKKSFTLLKTLEEQINNLNRSASVED